MFYMLDTNVIIDIMRDNPSIRSKVEPFIGRENHFCINPIVLSELFKGAYLSANSKSAIVIIEEITHSFELLEFNEFSCRLFGERYSELKKIGKPTQELDLMIGCIAIAHNAALITKNPNDFTNIKGLKVIAL